MTTTWKLRPNVKWQDGVPLTADDFLFAVAVEREKETSIPAYAEYELIDGISAPDPGTISVTWKRPYIDADGLFSFRSAGLPMAMNLPVNFGTPFASSRKVVRLSAFWFNE